MLYVGHFSFESPEKEKESDAFTVESKGGTFTCLVEADSLDDAADKFRDLIISHADSFEIFGSAGAVFIDAIIEVKKLPEEGVLTQLYEPLADGIGSFATTLPGVPAEFCVAYIRPPEEEEEEGQPAFITFGDDVG